VVTVSDHLMCRAAADHGEIAREEREERQKDDSDPAQIEGHGGALITEQRRFASGERCDKR
jgi:hypothetical protein